MEQYDQFLDRYGLSAEESKSQLVRESRQSSSIINRHPAADNSFVTLESPNNRYSSLRRSIIDSSGRLITDVDNGTSPYRHDSRATAKSQIIRPGSYKNAVRVLYESNLSENVSQTYMDGGGAAAAASLARAGSIRSQQSSSLEHPRKNSSIEIIKQAREEYSRYNNSGGGGSSILKKQPAPTLPNKRRYNSDIDNESAEEIDMR